MIRALVAPIMRKWTRTFNQSEGKAAKDSLIYLVGRGVGGVLGLWAVPLLVRLLGAKDYGHFSLLLLETLLVPQVTGAWLQQATLRYRHEWALKGQISLFQATQQSLLYGTFFASFLVMALNAYFLHHQGLGLSAGLGLIAALGCLQTVWLASAQAELNALKVVVAELLRVGAPVALLLGAMHFCTVGVGFAVFVVAFGWSASVLFLAPTCAVWAKGAFDRHLASKFLRFGLPMGIWFGINSCQYYIGRVLLHRPGLEGDLGIYSAFQDISIKIGTVVLMPMVYSVHASGMALIAEGRRADANRLLFKALMAQILVITAGLGIWLMFRNPLATLLVGRSAAQHLAGRPMLGLAVLFATLLPNVSLLVHKPLEFAGRPDLMVVSAAIACVFGAGVAWGAVGAFGALGSAIGLLATNGAYMSLTYLQGRRL